MEKFAQEKPKQEKPKEEYYAYDKEIEEIAFRAAEMAEFQEAVKKSKGKLEAISKVRVLLKQHFPEIEAIPKPRRTDLAVSSGRGLMPPVSNEFIIARNIVDLLYEESD